MKSFLRKLPGMLLPPPRRKPRLAEALPALLFIIAFAAACAAVELLHIATFARPARFGWALVLPWLTWQHLQGWHGLGGWRGPAALLTRLALAGACVAALAEPRAVRSSRDLSVVFALDVSDSIGDSARRKALEFFHVVRSADLSAQPHQRSAAEPGAADVPSSKRRDAGKRTFAKPALNCQTPWRCSPRASF